VLPGEATLADEMTVVAVEAIHAARESARAALGQALAEPFGRPIAASPIPGPTASTGLRSDGARCAMRALVISPPATGHPVPASPRRSSMPNRT